MGPNSGMALVVFVAVLVVRLVASQRRRTMGRPGGASASRGFAARPGPSGDGGTGADTFPGTGPSASGATFGGTAPGWFRDPFVRHEQRFWSGTAWTEHVRDQGAAGTDPPPPPRRPAT